MSKEKLIHQLFIGKVTDEIGLDKTYKLLKEATDAIEKAEVTYDAPCDTCENNKEHDKRIRCNKQFTDESGRELWHMCWCKHSYNKH